MTLAILFQQHNSILLPFTIHTHRIPTQKEELFAYPLDWSVLDKDLMERRVKSWINKKIVEYIGEEEPSLCGFICSKVLAQSQPENILQDVAIVSFILLYYVACSYRSFYDL